MCWRTLFFAVLCWSLLLLHHEVSGCTNFQGPIDNSIQLCAADGASAGNPPVFYMASRVTTPSVGGLTVDIHFQSNDTRMESGMISYPCGVAGGVGPYGTLSIMFTMIFTSANADAPFLCVSQEADAANKVEICLSATGEAFYSGYRQGIQYNTTGVMQWDKFPMSGASYFLTINFLTPDAASPGHYVSASIDNRMPFIDITDTNLSPFGITVPASETFIQPGPVVIYGDANYRNHFTPNDDTVYSLSQVDFVCNASGTTTPSTSVAAPSTSVASPSTSVASPSTSTASQSTSLSPSTTTTTSTAASPATASPTASATVVPPGTCESTDFSHLNCQGQPAVIVKNVTVSTRTVTDVGNCGGCTGVSVNGTLEIPTGAIIRIPVDVANSNASFLNVSGCVRFQDGSVLQIATEELTASVATVNVLSAQCIEGLDKVQFQVETKNSKKRYCLMSTAATIHGYDGAMSLLLSLSACRQRTRHWWIYLLIGLVIVTCVTVVTAITLACFCKEWQPRFRKSRVRAVTSPLLLPA